MPTKIFSFTQTSNSDLAVTPAELLARYFFGIDVVTPDGTPMGDEEISFFIRAAQEEMEHWLNVKMQKQVIEEKLRYTMHELKSWGYIGTSYPVQKAHSLTGFLGTIHQIKYPVDWLSSKSTNAGIKDYQNTIHIVPTTDEAEFKTGAFAAIFPHAGVWGQPNIPHYWRVEYCTPGYGGQADIQKAIGMLAAMGIFHNLGDIILGAGVASKTISIDNLSESIQTTSSATNAGYGARIINYAKELKEMLPKLKDKYDSVINLGVL